MYECVLFRAVLEWDNLRTLFLAFILLAELCASNCALPLNRPADMVDTDSFSDIAEHRYIRDDSMNLIHSCLHFLLITNIFHVYHTSL